MSTSQMKRVRKEIRDLSSTEWDAVARAFWIMKNTSDDDGKLLYGKDFISYDSMISKHMTAAFDPRGDQAHFGPVLGLFHRAWLLQLENSIRTVDRSIEALPYWDFAKDVSPLSDSYTSIFDDKYFGSYVGQAPDYSIVNGKFAKWPIKQGHQKWRNAYGLMRHPLSPNKSPYLTRKGGSICGYNLTLGDPTMWNMCLDVGGHISEWTACVDSNIHGPAHSSIAGSWFRDGQTSNSPYCAQWYGFISPPIPSSVINPNQMSRYPYGTFINPYALNCFDCPSCSTSQSSDMCMCIPNNENSECGPLWTNLIKGTNSGQSGSFLRKTAGTLNTTNMIQLADSAVIQILGDVGDPAASPNDPIFWAHHANIDRHFETWMIKHPAAKAGYFYYPTSGFAVGCNLNDVINSLDPFQNLDMDNNTTSSQYTVKDMFDRFTGDHTPYTYDSIVIAETQRRPDKISFRKLVKSSYEGTSARTKGGVGGRILDQANSEYKAGLGGILRGEYKKRPSSLSHTDALYIMFGMIFFFVVLILQHLFQRMLNREAKKPPTRSGDLKINITKEMRADNKVQSPGLELDPGSEIVFGPRVPPRIVPNSSGLGLHCRTPNSTGELSSKRSSTLSIGSVSSPIVALRSKSPRL